MLNCSRYLASKVPPIAQMHEKKNEPYIKLIYLLLFVLFFVNNF